jgi:hypothetical protein
MRIKVEFMHISALRVKVYHDLLHLGRVYQRIIGGIYWPSNQPGAVVAVGETLSPFREEPAYYVLDIAEDTSLEGLITAALAVKADCQVQAFYGDNSDKAAVNFLTSRNLQARRNREASLWVMADWHLKADGLITYHLNSLQQLMNPATKRLYLENKRLTVAFSQMPTEVHKAKAGDSPLLAALGFAVIAMTTQPFKITKSNKKKRGLFDSIVPETFRNQRM